MCSLWASGMLRLLLVFLSWMSMCVVPAATASASFAGGAGIGRAAPSALRSDDPFADIESAVEHIDGFWRDLFAAGGQPYRPPAAVDYLEGATATGCGVHSPDDSAFFYCGADESIYLVPEAIVYISGEHGDYGPILILAHEWGHHVQYQLGTMPGSSKDVELQADCMAGAWTRHAQSLGLLEQGDVTEAAKLSAWAGDEHGDPEAAGDPHGTNDERITFFMRGYDDGIGDCALPLGAPSGGPRAAVLYQPDAIADALLVTPFTDEELLSAASPVAVRPDLAGVLHEVRIQWVSGTLVYQVFADEAAAADVRDLGREVFLRKSPGKTMWLYEDTGGAVGCAFDANVRVCASSTPSLSDYPDGAAILAVQAGMLHLQGLWSQAAISAPPTAAPLPTPRPRPTPTNVSVPGGSGYDPDLLAAVLLSTGFPTDVLFGVSNPELGEVDSPEIAHEIAIVWGEGMIFYDIFRDADQVAVPRGIGTPMTLEDGSTVWIVENDDGAAACVREANVRICSISIHKVSDSPFAAAFVGVQAGLDHLRDVTG